MQLTVTGKQVDVGDALRRHIEASLSSILGKYFKTAIEAHVVLSKEAHLSRAEISIHIGRGIVVNAHATAAEAYAAFAAAAERLAKQLRRYKRRLRDHHAKGREPAASGEPAVSGERAMDYVLAPIGDEEAAEGEEVEEESAEAGFVQHAGDVPVARASPAAPAAVREDHDSRGAFGDGQVAGQPGRARLRRHFLLADVQVLGNHFLHAIQR